MSDLTNARLQRRKKNEQCLLLHYLLQGAVANAEEGANYGFAHFNQSCKYTSFIPINGSPTEMMSVLTGRSDLASLLHLTPYQLSFLVPKIRIYKTYVGQPGTEFAGRTWDVEMLFADTIAGIIESSAQLDPTGVGYESSLERMMSNRSGRGTGVGIKGFSWRYEGTNPAEAANLLSANLSLHFNDIRELFEKRGPFNAILNPPSLDEEGEFEKKEECYFQFVDLIMRTASTGEASDPPRGINALDASSFCKWMWLYDPEYFEIKAVVGWEFKDGAPFSEAQRQNLKSASIILYLTIYDHVISYNEDGTMDLDISYKAAIEAALEDRNTDLFLTVYERTRQAQVEAMREALTTGQEQMVSGDGNVSAAPDAYGRSPSSPATTGVQDSDNQFDEKLEDALETHLEELRALTRGMGYATLQKWIWDETYIPTLEDQHLATASGIVPWPGRKLAVDPVDYSTLSAAAIGSMDNARHGVGRFSSGHTPAPEPMIAQGVSEYGGDTSAEGLYGAPWPLSYGRPHGATFAETDPAAAFLAQGLSRIKTVLVRPRDVGVIEARREEGETPGAGITFVAPPWSQSATAWYLRRDGISDTGMIPADGLSQGTGVIDSGSDNDRGAIGDQMDNAIAHIASPGEAEGERATEDITNRLIENSVNRHVYHKGRQGVPFSTGEESDDEIAAMVGDNTYPLRYIYYGDLLDWAIRKALWRPPYTPDQFYVALDSFRDMVASSAGQAQADPLYRSFDYLQALAEWDNAPNTPGTNTNELRSDATGNFMHRSGDQTDSILQGGGLIGADRAAQSNDETSSSQQSLTISQAIDTLDNLKARKFDKLNIIVGSIEYYDAAGRKTETINIADIPISLARWNEFFVNRIQRPGVYSYNLKQFINDTLNYLVLDILGGRGCYEDTSFTNQTFDISINNFTLPAYFNPETEQYESPVDFITSSDMYINASPSAGEDPNYRIDINKIRAALGTGEARTSLFETSEDNTEVFHFIAIYARGYETSTLLGLETDEEAQAATEPGGYLEQHFESQGVENAYQNNDPLPGDLNRGIFHFYLGQNQGMIKSIKFTRTDQEYLAESRLMGHGAFGYNQLRGRYEATIVMQGNTFFLPGQFVYINPDSVGTMDSGTNDYNDAALLLGLGGYYVVLDIESAITPEFYETTLKCVWHSAGRVDICNLAGGTESDLINTRSAGARFTADDAASFAASISGLSVDGEITPVESSAPAPPEE